MIGKEIEDLIKVNNNGLEIATFVQVREALTRRYKSIYGIDINLSNATADGVFVNNMSLIINNLLQVTKLLYSGLDIRYANGKYLDVLCAFTNLTRKQATKSTAKILVKNIGTSTVLITKNFTAIDNNGVEWYYKGDEISLIAGEQLNINLECELDGAIEAPEGSINNIVERLAVEITQIDDAIVGQNEETDTQLRERRDKASSTNGIGVLESLYGALLNVSGVIDVKIYNNFDDGTAKDNTNLPAHSIYVILRKKEGAVLNAEEVGKTIFERLTPAIKTVEALANGKSYDYVQKGIGFIPMLANFTTTVFWCETTSVKPKIVIDIDELDFFDNSEIEIVGEKLLKWLNSLPIGKDLTDMDIKIKLLNLDTKYLNQRIYNINIITIAGSDSYENKDKFYNYTISSYNSGTKKLTLE